MRISLHFKVTGFISLLMLLVGIASALFFIHSYYEGLEREITARGVTMAESLSRSIDEGLAAENIDLISHVKKLGYQEDVVLAQVFSTLWLPIDAYPVSKFDTPPNADVIRHFQTRHNSIHLKDGSLFEFYSPVFFHEFDKSNERKYIIGFVRLTLTPERSLASLNKTVTGYVIIFVSVTLITILVLTIFVRRKVLMPLLNLQRSVTASLHSSLPEPVTVDGNDELSDLSRSFNIMVCELGERENKLHQQNIELEEEIAERQRTQEELQEQTTRLEMEIVERQSAQEQLAIKQRQLEELNRSLEIRITETVSELRDKDRMLIQQGRLAAMGEMIHNIAHQWRQPLNNVGLIIQNLQFSIMDGSITKEELDKEVTNAMELIIHMSRTIDDFRNFFRPEKEKQGFIINDVIQHALNFISASLESNHIELVLSEDDEIAVVGYPNEYTQVFLNIMDNARDSLVASKNVAARITIHIFKDGESAVMTIADNGGGIPEDVLPKIFDPYFTTKEPGKGTGIGLYMSKVIIEKNMDGHLTARNIDGGAEFRIEL